MKKFVLRLSIFLAILFLLDRGFGLAMDYLRNNAKGGYIGHHNHIIHQSNEDILIFGSSRAIHHYNPEILEDSIGMSCYNCGQDGNGIILFYGWWQIMKNRYQPKIVIYDVTPAFDLLEGEDNRRYLGWLKSEYENKEVKRIFEDIDPTEKYKMQSMMYRYNSTFLQIITDYSHPIFRISPDGFLPLEGEMNTMKLKDDSSGEITSFSYDSLKIAYLKSFIESAQDHGVKLMFVASPIWYGMSDAVFAPLEDLCFEKSVPFYNYANDTNYVGHNEMFKDGNHLNAFGADEFTKEICKLLK